MRLAKGEISKGHRDNTVGVAQRLVPVLRQTFPVAHAEEGPYPEVDG